MMDNQPRARSHLSIKSRHKNGIGRSDGASVTLNVHPALAANPTGILKTPIRLFLIPGIILEFHADLLKLCHSCASLFDFSLLCISTGLQPFIKNHDELH